MQAPSPTFVSQSAVKGDPPKLIETTLGKPESVIRSNGDAYRTTGEIFARRSFELQFRWDLVFSKLTSCSQTPDLVGLELCKPKRPICSRDDALDRAVLGGNCVLADLASHSDPPDLVGSIHGEPHGLIRPSFVPSMQEQALRAGFATAEVQISETETPLHRLETVYRRATAIDPKISIATVYRSLKLFEDANVLVRHDFGEGRARYEETGTHHEHLIDIETGEVIEFLNEEIEQLKERIARDLGYELVDHRLELYGRRIRKQ
jgi:Fur family transcriptional regulator, ferric uptake regulator